MKTMQIFTVNDEYTLDVGSGFEIKYTISAPVSTKAGAEVITELLTQIRAYVRKMWEACEDRVFTDSYDGYWDASRDINTAETVLNWFSDTVKQAVRFSMTVSRECDNKFSGVNVYSLSNIEYTFKDIMLDIKSREEAENNI